MLRIQHSSTACWNTAADKVAAHTHKSPSDHIHGARVRTMSGSTRRISATNVRARTTSRVVTPKSVCGLKHPASLSTSAAIGTVLLTGLVMIVTQAVGHACAEHNAFTRGRMLAWNDLTLSSTPVSLLLLHNCSASPPAHMRWSTKGNLCQSAPARRPCRCCGRCRRLC